MTNKSVNSLKIDESTLQVYGTVDADGDDETRYDAVVLASDVGTTQEIFNSTLLFYRKSLNVRKVLQNVNQSFIGRMKVAPDYKVWIKLFLIPKCCLDGLPTLVEQSSAKLPL